MRLKCSVCKTDSACQRWKFNEIHRRKHGLKQRLPVQLLSPAPQMNAQTMDLNRLCVFFLQKKRLKLPVRLQQAGKFASGFQWMFPGISADVSGDFCGQRTKTMQEMRKRNARECLYRENSEKRPMLSAEIAKSSWQTTNAVVIYTSSPRDGKENMRACSRVANGDRL